MAREAGEERLDEGDGGGISSKMRFVFGRWIDLLCVNLSVDC